MSDPTLPDMSGLTDRQLLDLIGRDDELTRQFEHQALSELWKWRADNPHNYEQVVPRRVQTVLDEYTALTLGPMAEAARRGLCWPVKGQPADPKEVGFNAGAYYAFAAAEWGDLADAIMRLVRARDRAIHRGERSGPTYAEMEAMIGRQFRVARAGRPCDECGVWSLPWGAWVDGDQIRAEYRCDMCERQWFHSWTRSAFPSVDDI